MEIVERAVTYAQNREDIILSAFFPDEKHGFYVDVGANDPEKDSVTKYFYDRGWHGINIEPNSSLYKKLKEHRPRDANLNVGVSNKAAKLLFREYEGHGLSTFSDVTKKELDTSHDPLVKKYHDYEVEVQELKDILKAADPAAIDFMKIDVEGYEYEVITSNDWNAYRPKVLCVEANHIHKDWKAVLSKNGYKQVYDDGLNAYFIDAKRKTPPMFDYVQSVIGREIIPAFAEKEIANLNGELSKRKSELSILRNINREQQDRIEYLEAYMLERSRLKSLLRELLAKIDSIITTRLTKRIHRKKKYPVIDIDVRKITDPKSILVRVQAADKEVFFKQSSALGVFGIGILKVLYFCYIRLRRLVGKVLRFIKKIIRKR